MWEKDIQNLTETFKMLNKHDVFLLDIAWDWLKRDGLDMK